VKFEDSLRLCGAIFEMGFGYHALRTDSRKIFWGNASLVKS
jgi:hypothetical protein